MRSHTSIALLCGAVLLALTTGCPPADDDYGYSLRIATFNVQFLPGRYGDEDRAGQVAQRVLASTYDIIAFNEVFDEDARDVLVDRLQGRFPHYLARVNNDTLGPQDSGLMLFSRFPFIALPNPTLKVEPDNVIAVNGTAGDWKEVGFIEYGTFGIINPDLWSAKGIVFLRIRHPALNRVFNVGITHTQASYHDDETTQEEWTEPQVARYGQFQDIRRMLEDELGELLNEEDTFVMGDLNVDGDLTDPYLDPEQWGQQSINEWEMLFNYPGTFFTDVMYDTWAYDQPRTDRGLTNLYEWGSSWAPDCGARLDYILRNRPSAGDGVKPRLAVQHLTLAHNMRINPPYSESGLGMAGIDQISDHIGVNADINAWAPRCSPMEAAANPSLDMLIPGEITYPGSMQWYRFDTAGTYAFGIEQSGFEYRVYDPADMSTPVRQYFDQTRTLTPNDGKPVTAGRFHVPSAPFYVRVYPANRASTGRYDLVGHRYAGASQEDACVLRPYDPVDYQFPDTPLNAEDTAWFELHTEQAFSGASQELRFALRVNKSDKDNFELYLRGPDGLTDLASSNTAVDDPEHPEHLLVTIDRNDLSPAASTYYLLVKRLNPALTQCSVWWETNLTLLHGWRAGIPGAEALNLFCEEETDTLDDDEVYLTVRLDGRNLLNDVYIGWFTDTYYRNLEDLITTHGFLQTAEISLREEDGGLNGADDYLSTTIPALPPGQINALARMARMANDGGSYIFRYNLSRSLQTAAP